jgi:hypothetical protein
MQDQLLAESEAAVPAEMVREFQVAGLIDQAIGRNIHRSFPRKRESSFNFPMVVKFLARDHTIADSHALSS